MACRKHNYKGNKSCRGCQSDRAGGLWVWLVITLVLFWVL